MVNNPYIQSKFLSQTEFDQYCHNLGQSFTNHYCQNFPINLPNQNDCPSKEPLSIATPLSIPSEGNHWSDQNTNDIPIELYNHNEFTNLNEPLTIEILAKRFSEEFSRLQNLATVQERQLNENALITQKILLQGQKIAFQTQEINALKRKLEDMEKSNKPKKVKNIQNSLQQPFNSPINLKNVPTVVSPPNLKQLPNQKAGQGIIKFSDKFIQETGRKNTPEENPHIQITKKTPKSSSSSKKQKTNF